MNQHFAQAKVTARKLIAVPKKVQDTLGGLEEGDYLLFYEENGRIYIKLEPIRKNCFFAHFFSPLKFCYRLKILFLYKV